MAGRVTTPSIRFSATSTTYQLNMLSPDKPPFKGFSPLPRHSRSCSALPKCHDNLSWEDAISVIERSGSQSYFQEKISTVQRKIQSLRPLSRSSDNPSRTIDSHRQRRALSASLSPSLRSDGFYNDHLDPEQLKVEIASSLPPNDKPEWQLMSAQIANSLPPDHLEPPPTYWQAYMSLHDPSIHQESQPNATHHRREDLLLPPHLIHPAFRPPVTIITPPLNTPNLFELEHWFRMNGGT